MLLRKYIAIFFILLISLHVVPDIVQSNNHENTDIECAISELLTVFHKRSPSTPTFMQSIKKNPDEQKIIVEKQLDEIVIIRENILSNQFNIIGIDEEGYTPEILKHDNFPFKPTLISHRSIEDYIGLFSLPSFI